MKHRMLSLVLAAALLLSLTACGQQGGETTAAAGNDKETTAPAETTPALTDADLAEYDAKEHIVLDKYTGLEVEMADTVVTADEFDQALEYFLEGYAEKEKITDRITAEGDTIVIDYSGVVDGVVFSGGTAKEQVITLGAGGFIDGFEEGLIGQPCGKEFVVEATFPDPYQYNQDLAGKTAQFTMYIHYIEGKDIMPELTDEFVKGLEDYTCGTVAEFKDVFMQELSEDKKAYMVDQAKTAMWEILLDTVEVKSYPKNYVEYYIQDMLAYYNSIVTMYGMTLDDFVAAYGMTMEEFNETLEEGAKQQVEIEMIYQYIAEKENIVATEQDYLDMVKQYMEAEGYTDMTSFVNAYGVEVVERQGYADALYDKVTNFCFEKAVIVPMETEAETEAETTAAE